MLIQTVKASFNTADPEITANQGTKAVSSSCQDEAKEWAASARPTTKSIILDDESDHIHAVAMKYLVLVAIYEIQLGVCAPSPT